MQLKQYQTRAMNLVEFYIQKLNEAKKIAITLGDNDFIYCELAWKKIKDSLEFHHRKYTPKTDGINRELPNFCLKIPTGGGKTLLAIKSLDMVQTQYLRKRFGFVLWIVPTQQIYEQTLKSLKDRHHPYRQHLNMISGDHVMIIEKNSHFSPIEVAENLVIMILMLPSANRESKESLKMFQDSGANMKFFPKNGDIQGHQDLLTKFPNLTHYKSDLYMGHEVYSSLGNCLAILNPVIILDEGHKAYSERAQQTLMNFNPSFLIELSATPPPNANILIDIKGRELEQEEMMKLDLHIFNKSSADWKDTLLASIEKLNFLQQSAEEYRQNQGRYIRPIMLIQVERTGKDMRDDGKVIHADQVKEYLIKQCAIMPEQIAIKTSAQNELKESELQRGELLTESSPIRFIITKSALQEGWDCPFAYILTILNNPQSKTALTQLVGRVLRQPYAQKTKIMSLDESYVFLYQQHAKDILKQIKDGFEIEGIGDLSSRISQEISGDSLESKQIINKIRPKFKEFAQSLCLPVFAVRNNIHDADDNNWRPVSYRMDLLARINYDDIKIEDFQCALDNEIHESHIKTTINSSDELISDIAKEFQSKENFTPLDISRHIPNDLIPNPWVAYQIGKQIHNKLLSQYNLNLMMQNSVLIIEKTKEFLKNKVNLMAKNEFLTMMKNDEMRFIVLSNHAIDFSVEPKVNDSVKMLNKNNDLLGLSLFENTFERDYNEMEKEIVYFLDKQEDLFCWYRNISRNGYDIQGWQRHKIYPDFIFAKNNNQANDNHKVYVVESKGLHLKGNQDTQYKQQIFEICNENAYQKQIKLSNLIRHFKIHDTKYEIIYSDDWREKLAQLIAS